MAIKINNPLIKPYIVTSGYGWRTLKGKKVFHYGVDLIGEGRSICAVKNCFKGKATVLRSYFSITGGNTIIMEHITEEGDRYIALYCHLDKRYVSKTGSIIEVNQEIGMMGNTGHSYGAHLHFQLHYDKSKKQSPFTFFKNIGNLDPSFCL